MSETNPHLMTLTQAQASLTAPEVREEDDTSLSWKQIAASAYRAYGACTGGKNVRGEPLPAFEDLPAPIQTAWKAAARQVGICIEYGDRAFEAEAGWRGWEPPQESEGHAPPNPVAMFVDRWEPGSLSWYMAGGAEDPIPSE